MRNNVLGRCPLCGTPCRSDEEIAQIHGGRDGFAHLDCVQQAAEEVVDQERTHAAG